MSFPKATQSKACGVRFAIVLVVVSITLLTCSTIQPGSDHPVIEPHYALIIDAGSSGSRIYVYHVEPDRIDDLPAVELVGSSKVEPGISEWDADPESARKKLEGLLNFAKEKIDNQERKNTSLYLMATAGMRLLSAAKREKIMSEISELFATDGTFALRQVVVISGAYEGLYSWIAANYLDDYLDPQQTREGIMEMGGASTQITFSPSNKNDDRNLTRRFRNRNYSIVSKSYLYLGLHQAQRFTDVPSCYPVDYPISSGRANGTGSFNRCVTEIVEQFTALCENLERDGPHCIFNQQTTIPLETDFYAISAFFYTFSFLGLNEQVDPAALMAKGRSFCSQDWRDLRYRYNKTPEKYLSSYCFSAAYFWGLISRAYGFSNGKATIRPVEKIGGTEVSWTLGALIDIELGNHPVKYRPGGRN